MKMQLAELLELQTIDSRLDELAGTQVQEPVTAPAPPVVSEALAAAGDERERLQRERRTIVAAVRPELLRYYERVRRRHPQAVVGTSDGSCLGCFTRRPTSMASRPGGFETCERCGRILIRPES